MDSQQPTWGPADGACIDPLLVIIFKIWPRGLHLWKLWECPDGKKRNPVSRFHLGFCPMKQFCPHSRWREKWMSRSGMDHGLQAGVGKARL